MLYDLKERGINNMKKAAQILFLVSAILSIVAAVGYLIGGIVMVASGAALPIGNEMLKEQGQQYLTDEQLAAAMASAFTAGGTCLFFVPFSIANIIISFKARHTAAKPLFIVAIVLGALSSTVVSIVAGIFGLIAGDTL